MDFDVIVIGSGPGGYVAAIRASQLGFRTAVVERAELGGVCLNWGCIPTKALLKSAQVYRYAKHAAEYGVVIDGEIKPDFGAFVARSRGVAETMQKGVMFLLNKYKVEIIAGEACLKPGKTVQVKMNEDGAIKTFTAHHIILATGSRSKVLPNLPQDGKKIIGYRQAMTLPVQPESMVVVGSGAIGSEFAHFYQSIGTKVTLVEFMPQIVPVEDADSASQISRSFRKNGMKVLVESAVERVDTDGDKCKVHIRTKKGEEVHECDIVLSAVGVVPNTDNLGLEELGIVIEKGKIVTDEYCRTNVEGIYAIGDITPGAALAHVASREAKVCVEKIAGLDPVPVDYSNIPGCTYTSPEIASVGLTEKKALEAGYELKVGRIPFTASGKATAMGNRDGFVKVIFDAKTNLLLGCHMTGENVTEMIAEAVMVRQQKITAQDIMHGIHPHPTLSESFLEAVEAAYNECVHC
ncbi:MAG: dihydrolipoyl dehydrogenase [Bacteroidales bacterium]|nr:dihydrolipoyl dehydrogenase [Bacteroidales bacterium]